MTRWTRLPIRRRLTVVFAASMAMVVSVLSVFVYFSSGSDLLDAIDAGLRSRAEAKVTYFDRPVPGIDNLARVLAVPVETSRGRFVVLVGASLQDRKDELTRLAKTLAIAGVIALGLISLGAWLAVSAALRPVDRMRRQAAAISASGPGQRLSQPGGNDELALLGATLNQMLNRIEESVDSERRLVDSASHELRTPLAIQRIDEPAFGVHGLLDPV